MLEAISFGFPMKFISAFSIYRYGLLFFLASGFAPYSSAVSTDDLVVSRGTSPEVAYRLDLSSVDELAVTVTVKALDPSWPAPRVSLGLSAVETLTLSPDQAKVEKMNEKMAYTFQVKRKELDAKDMELKQLRLAFAVEWINPDGEVIQRENFFMSSTASSFTQVGQDASRWLPFSLVEYSRLMENFSQQIRVSWDQPADGKASLVVENEQGVRVRNLVSGRSFSSGKQTVVWDGLDENGNLVPPATYTWRTVTHPGIKAEFKMSYYNPGNPGWKDGPTSRWLGDHSAPMCAASNGDLIAIGCPVAESGNNIVILDQQGNKLQDGNLSSFIGSGNLFLAMDGERFYAFSEGVPHYDKVRKDEDGKDYLYGSLSFVAWNLKDGNQYRYKGTGKNGDKIVREYQMDPKLGVRYKHVDLHNLRGVVYLNSALYVSLHDENKIQLLDPDSGESLGEIAIEKPGAVATDGSRLLVYSGKDLVLFEQPGAGAIARKLFTPDLSQPKPLKGVDSVATTLAFGTDNRIYAADNGVDQNIKVYDLSGKRLSHIGQKGGGVEEGIWIPNSVRLPMGLALDGKNQLWVAENHFRPKRVSVWNSQDGKLVKELFGPAHYGASGAGFDTADITQWLGGGAMWNIDIDTQEVQIESALFSDKKKGMPTSRFYPFSAWFLHKDGRNFLISKDNVMRLYEIMPDKRAKLWAMFGSLHAYEAESPRWWVPTVFTEHPQLKETLKDFTDEAGPYGNFRNSTAASKDGRELSVMWIDRNGDDAATVDELQVAGDATRQFRGSIWGYHAEDTLDWKVMVALADGKTGVGELKMHGWLPSGAPDWRLDEALMKAQLIPDAKMERGPQSFAQDSKGRFLLNSHPMLGIGADNQVQWTFPNDWTGVHGSHKAPLPETGVLQGSLSYLGMAPLDEQGDVTVINGNHGRFFVMTSDGMYLDEMFQDVRLSRDASAYRIGGECFGGYFGKDKKSGRYILQSGHSDYRIFEINGLDQVKRQQGTLEVSPTQVVAAQKLMEKKVAEEYRAKDAVLATATADGKTPAASAEWGDASQRFPYVKATAYREGSELVLTYEVKDPSPWVNQGKDRQLLFKSGDVVVFEFSTDREASPNRSEPATGDKRLMIAPYLGESVAILYDYRIPGTKHPVPFSSPWRTATVDQVKLLDSAVLDIQKSRDGYVMTARIPLTELGLPATGTDKKLKGDFGVIYGDEKGNTNILRSYWSNQSTALVNDVPGETMINPAMWGNLEWK